MKIRCGSHQQNRSIVRPGLSLMAAKVALTAEEFRENSQRSIALFNTEKLSTNSTHVLKSAYCNSVHFCRCNLHGACGGKGFAQAELSRANQQLQSARSVWRQRSTSLRGDGRNAVAICTERVEAKLSQALSSSRMMRVAICTERVEAKQKDRDITSRLSLLQSARSVWRQSMLNRQQHGFHHGCNLHGACGGKARRLPDCVTTVLLQSARSVWRQRWMKPVCQTKKNVAICTERVEAKLPGLYRPARYRLVAICTERVEAKVRSCRCFVSGGKLQSARSVWRQSATTFPPVEIVPRCNLHGACGGKGLHYDTLGMLETLQSARSVWRQSPLRFVWGASCNRCNLHGACGGKDCVKPVSDTLYRCNLHGACGGKGALQFHPYY